METLFTLAMIFTALFLLFGRAYINWKNRKHTKVFIPYVGDVPLPFIVSVAVLFAVFFIFER